MKREHNNQQQLKQRLKEKLDEKGLTMNAAAVQVGVPPGSLKAWISQNRFPAELLAKFKDLKWLTDSDLKLPHSVARHRRTPTLLTEAESLEQAFNQMSNFAEHMGLLQGQFDEIIALLFDSLSKADEFVYISLNEIPIEWQLDGWGKAKKAITRAVCQSGARLIYAFPSDKELRKAKENFHGLGIIEGEFQSLFSEFLDRVIAECHGQKNPDEIKKSVRLVETNLGFFHTPNTKTAFFRQISTNSTGAFVSYRRGNQWLSIPHDPALCGKLMRWLVKEKCIEV